MNKETSNTSAPLDWYTLLSLLPLGWEEQAREAKAFVRARKFPTPGEFLRMLLLHVAGDLPLSETAAFWSLDETQITHMTIQRGLERCPEWIEWICNQLIADLNVKVRVSESTPGAPLSEIPVILVDGTTIRQPGSAGTNQRVHLALNVRADHTAALLGTDAHTGEKFGNFVIAPGALYIGDRGYGNRAGIAHVVRGGGYVLVRINAQNLPLDTPDGERFDLPGALRTLPEHEAGEWTVVIPGDPNSPPIAGRVCAQRLTPEARAKAEQQVRKQSHKKGHTVKPETVEMAGYLVVFTTLPRSVADAQTVLDLFRARWQIEIVFKRDKQVLHLGNNPKKNPRIARAWLALKLLCALLMEALRQKAEASFSPSAHSGVHPETGTQPVAGMETPGRAIAANRYSAHLSRDTVHHV
jgi:hypothetical protein